jgi:hypothetical protein
LNRIEACIARTLLICIPTLAVVPLQCQQITTAWHEHQVQIDAAGLVGRSRIILERPNFKPNEAMPLGNGTLGVSVWSEGGFRAQLNRIDTMPHRLSPGQLVVPSMDILTRAPDYRAWLDLYRGEFVETGAGIRLTAFVQPKSDLLEIDVSGADPGRMQTADLLLWAPRSPSASVKGAVGQLVESWIDNHEPGASGKQFGSIAGITAAGRNVHVAMIDSRTLRMTWLPYPDGSFRIFVASPGWRQNANPSESVQRAFADTDQSEHRVWWQRFWDRAGLIRVDSQDGVGEYMENLRMVYLYAAASERGIQMPGSQGGIADLFSAVRDARRWDPAAYWHLNLRMQVAANLDAGLPELNHSYFALYRDNLPVLRDWTRSRMRGRPGICLPETMRFNGVGIEYETSGENDGGDRPSYDCDAGSPPFYNARTISTGAEVSYWIWQQYLMTGDISFLRANYPLMKAAAQFLMAYETPGADGFRHTFPSNAHETQWDVTDPSTDLSARHTLYRDVIAAAQVVNLNDPIVKSSHAELSAIPPFPLVAADNQKQLLRDQSGDDRSVIAESAQPDAPQHNFENIGLEPVWPYGLIGDDDVLTALGRRTFEHRPYPTNQDWSFDPVQAARLGLNDQVGETLEKLTKTYQGYPNGLSNWGGGSGEFYIEQSAIVALTLSEALVQDYDGVIRIAPAVPSGWTMAGTVAIQGRSRVYVETNGSEVGTCILKAGSNQSVSLRSPWQGHPIDVTDDSTGRKIITGSQDKIVHFAVLSNHQYIVSRAGQDISREHFSPLGGHVADQPKRLGNREIGLSSSGS